MASRNARADARVACVGGGRGRVGENAEVNVAERAQLRLKHDVLARGLRVIHVLRRVADIGRKLLAELLAPGKHVRKLIGLGTIDVLDREVFPLENGGKALLEILRIQELADHDGLLLIFVGVNRRNAAQRRAVLLVLEACFFQTVERAVIGEDDGRAVGNLKVFRRDGHTCVLERGHFLPEVLNVDDNAVAQHVHNTGQADAGGNQVQGKFTVLVHDGVTGVVAALIAADNVVFSCNEVDHTALALVTPVDANNCAVTHVRQSPSMVHLLSSGIIARKRHK